MSFFPSYTNITHGNTHTHLNPTNISTVTKVLSIDTTFRENYHTTESTDYTLTLPEPLNNVVSIRLSSMELPNMWYSFSAHNNTNIMYITTKGLQGRGYPDKTHTIVIPEGNYLATYFTPMINEIFKGTGQGLQFLKFTIDEYKAKTIFRAVHEEIDNETSPYFYNSDTGVTDVSFEYILDFRVSGVPYNQTAGWMMGFKNETYTVTFDDFYVDRSQVLEFYTVSGGEFVTVDGQTTLSGETVMTTTVSGETTTNVPLATEDEAEFVQQIYQFDTNGSGIDKESFPIYRGYIQSEGSFGANINQYIFFDVDDYQKNCASSTVIHANGDTNMGQNILGKLIVSSGQFTNIIDNGSDMIFKKRTYFGPIRLEKLRLRILDRFGNVIFLNNNDYSCSLEIEQIYSR